MLREIDNKKIMKFYAYVLLSVTYCFANKLQINCDRN